VAIKNPVDFCLKLESHKLNSVTLPFGLPPIRYRSACEDMFSDMQPINVQLNALLPILQLGDCIVKVMSFCTNLPVNIAALIAFNAEPLKEAVKDLTDCAGLLIQFTPAGALLDLCKTIKDSIILINTYIECVLGLIVVLETALEVEANAALSLDPGLLALVACLTLQNDEILAEVGVKLEAIGALLGIVNLLLGLVGLSPVGAVTTAASDLAGLRTSLEEIVVLLSTVEQNLPC